MIDVLRITEYRSETPSSSPKSAKAAATSTVPKGSGVQLAKSLRAAVAGILVLGDFVSRNQMYDYFWHY